MCLVQPAGAEVFRWCKKGEIELLQGALSRQEVSPFVVDPDGGSLLYYSFRGAQFDIIRLLLQLRVDANHEDRHGLKPSYFFNRYRIAGPDEKSSTFKSLVEAQEEVSLTDLSNYLTFSPYNHMPADVLLTSPSSRGEIEWSDHDLFDILWTPLVQWTKGTTSRSISCERFFVLVLAFTNFAPDRKVATWIVRWQFSSWE